MLVISRVFVFFSGLWLLHTGKKKQSGVSHVSCYLCRIWCLIIATLTWKTKFLISAFGDLKLSEDLRTVMSERSIVPRREKEGLFVVRSNYSYTRTAHK